MDTLLVETYFDWLASEAFSLPSERREYEGVLRELHDIPFYWTILADDSRAGDALFFRQQNFLEYQTGLDDMDQTILAHWATAQPSVLEVLLGIARRWTFYFEGAPAFYFKHLFHNLGFYGCPGRSLTKATRERIRNQCDIWMSRQFEPNGEGSPFPLRQGFDGIPDMRQIDIWSQMNAYSYEHFQ